MAEHPVASDRSQRLAAIGGWLVVAGCALVLVPVVMAALGQTVAIGSSSLGGVALAVALAALGAGFALLAVTGPRSIGGIGVRVGLGLLAVGIAATLVASVIAGMLTYDPLEELSFVIPFVAGALAIVIGIPATLIALLVRGGSPRRVAATFLGGLAVVIVGGMVSSAILANDPTASGPPVVASLVSAAGLALMLVGTGGLGLTAIRGSEAPEAVAA